VVVHEARRTATSAGAVTSGAVTTRVVGSAVRRGTGAPSELRHTGAYVAVHEVVTRASVLTRIAGTLVYVRLTDIT